MQLETINKLYLKLSQIATAKTNKDIIRESQLTDARFWSIIKTLKNVGREGLAIYLVRAISGYGLSEARSYVENIDYSKCNLTNPLQIEE